MTLNNGINIATFVMPGSLKFRNTFISFFSPCIWADVGVTRRVMHGATVFCARALRGAFIIL